MATYTLIPSSLTGTGTITNASKAYADTSSANYATCSCRNYQTYGGGVYLGGFDFSVIPTTEVVLSITCKIKYRLDSTTSVFYSQIMSGVDGVALSSEKRLSSANTTNVTHTLTEDISTVLSYADTLCFHVYHKNAGTNYYTIYLYGAEIIVETGQKNYSKVVYDGGTLIDLTSDTATASDVASGKTFHLANGSQSIGTMSSSSIGTATTSNISDASYITIRNMLGEPRAFVFYLTEAVNYISMPSSQHVVYAIYDGSTSKMGYYVGGNSASTGGIRIGTFTFSYSSNILNISTSSGPKFCAGEDYSLLYVY